MNEARGRPGSIHQFLAGFARGDAISNEAVAIRRIFRSWGYDSRIFSEPRRILPELRQEAGDVADFRAACRPDDVVLLHLSIGSAVNEVFASIPCRKAILYHNITPPGFFEPVQKQIAASLAAGLKQAAALAHSAKVCMAVSKFNADELTRMGYRDVKLLPIILERELLDAPPDRRTTKEFSDGMTNVLFVGRGAPNKKIEDLLRAFSLFQKTVEPRSRLIHAGSYDGIERYRQLMTIVIHDLKLRDVRLVGAMPQARLNALYRSAHVFLCMSEHEGFCIPLIESMYHRVPVLAFAAGAIPETLDGAGVLFREKNFAMAAEIMGLLCRDMKLRDAVIRTQDARVERYLRQDLAGVLRNHMAPLLEQ